jgi:hypothetical protein
MWSAFPLGARACLYTSSHCRLSSSHGLTLCWSSCFCIWRIFSCHQDFFWTLLCSRIEPRRWKTATMKVIPEEILDRAFRLKEFLSWAIVAKPWSFATRLNCSFLLFCFLLSLVYYAFVWCSSVNVTLSLFLWCAGLGQKLHVYGIARVIGSSWEILLWSAGENCSALGDI